MKRTVLIGFSLASLFAAMVLLGCSKPQPGMWELCASLTNRVGERFLVAQNHYDWVEGWQVAFLRVETNGLVSGYFVQNETGRWRDVSLTEGADTVSVVLQGTVVGVFTKSTGTFLNLPQDDHVYDLTEGLEGGQSKAAMQVMSQFGISNSPDVNSGG